MSELPLNPINRRCLIKNVLINNIFGFMKLGATGKSIFERKTSLQRFGGGGFK